MSRCKVCNATCLPGGEAICDQFDCTGMFDLIFDPDLGRMCWWVESGMASITGNVGDTSVFAIVEDRELMGSKRTSKGRVIGGE
jgi:hypothetical protein